MPPGGGRRLTWRMCLALSCSIRCCKCATESEMVAWDGHAVGAWCTGSIYSLALGPASHESTVHRRCSTRLLQKLPNSNDAQVCARRRT